jgi:hypothetical protein
VQGRGENACVYIGGGQSPEGSGGERERERAEALEREVVVVVVAMTCRSETWQVVTEEGTSPQAKERAVS